MEHKMKFFDSKNRGYLEPSRLIIKVKVKKINLIENPIAGYKDKYTIEFEDEDNNKYICNYYGSKIQEFKDAFDDDKTIIITAKPKFKQNGFTVITHTGIKK